MTLNVCESSLCDVSKLSLLQLQREIMDRSSDGTVHPKRLTSGKPYLGLLYLTRALWIYSQSMATVLFANFLPEVGSTPVNTWFSIALPPRRDIV